MQSVPQSSFYHPDLVFTVDDLNDALYEESLKEPLNSSRFGFVLAGKYESDDGSCFINKITSTISLYLSSASDRGESFRAESAANVTDGIAYEELSDPSTGPIEPRILMLARVLRKVGLEFAEVPGSEPGQNRVFVKEGIECSPKMTLIREGHEELVDKEMIVG